MTNSIPPVTHAWAGSIPSLIGEPVDTLLRRLYAFVPDATAAQRQAWIEELQVLREQGSKVIEFDPPAREDSAVLEYALPREAGRRPDVLVLQNGRVVVVEFKQTDRPHRSALDQVQAYARDLAAYHEACDGLELIPVLVLCGKGASERTLQGVRIVPADRLSNLLVELARVRSGPAIDVDGFVNSEYAPLPSLVSAARLLFDNLPLPFVRRAQSAGVHRAVEHILELVQVARTSSNRSKHLVLLTGVPGAGKTLVGLQVAHSAALENAFAATRQNPRARKGAPATFLSGNGPLVQVLQHALKSRAFVQDMHRYIREYGLEHPDRIPPERLIVFDEAQRAWDEPKIRDFYSRKAPHVSEKRYASEPDLLIDIADRMEGWSLVLALVGEGQEIHTGEEAGLDQWVTAVSRSAMKWEVHGPSSLQDLFSLSGRPYHSERSLGLDVTLRAHAASDLHRWVELVLDDGDFAAARPLAERLRDEGFPIYLTRDLNGARSYARDRFAGEHLRRYGILASSKAHNLIPFDLDPGFQATKRIQVGPWFNDGPESLKSCTRLDTVITEFQCQGLELDLPIICWGDDFWWGNETWVSRQTRSQPLVRDPHRLRKNAYRVLLTRGREGMIIVIPPGPEFQMQTTANALLAAGAIHVRTVDESIRAHMERKESGGSR